MEHNIRNLELFFKYNIEVKNELVKCAPKEIYNYSDEARMEYGERLYATLEDMEALFRMMAKAINYPSVVTDINVFFSKLKYKLLETGFSYNRMCDFYKTYMESMSNALENSVRNEFVGYTLFGGSISNVMPDVKSVYELLHVFHSYVLNNEYSYEIIPACNKKEINGSEITLRGEEWDLANHLYDSINDSFGSTIIEIVSLPRVNKILIITRDIGHATSLEVNVDGDKALVRYFIPKVCNVLKVNQLNGINKVPVIISHKDDTEVFHDTVRFTDGAFECDINKLTSKVCDFLEECPTDEDLFEYGGWQYHLSRKFPKVA